MIRTCAACPYELFADFKLLNERAIFIDVLLGEIIEKAPSLTDHLQQSATTMVILGIFCEMGCERINIFGENCDLDFRAPRIVRRFAEFRSKLLLLFFGNWHV
jgi:hypothetical protein